ncbi:MAG: hypothetical protein LBI60_03575 [Bacteroidales bacterium]|nr:hypothetical protein [Bacteroidales bacterium]
MRRLYCATIIMLLGGIHFVYGQEEKMDQFPRHLYWGGLSNKDFFTSPIIAKQYPEPPFIVFFTK